MMRKIDHNLHERVKKVKQKHGKKLGCLAQTQAPQKTKRPPKNIDNFVVNLSSAQLTRAEMDLLNKGLNFAAPPQRAPLAEIVNSIESSIQYNNFTSKSAIRHDVEQCISNSKHKRKYEKQASFETWCAIRQLKSRDVVYSRADKGNAIVIMDKPDYDSRVLDMIHSGPYEEHKFKNGKPRDPLNTMIEQANLVRHEVAHLLGEEKFERKLHVPNPKVALLYCLPKIHKNPVAMRPISSNICTPTEKMAAWLVDEMKKYPVTHGKSVKNSLELADHLKDFELRRGEVLVSFDVIALFPNVPVDEALRSLRRHLERKRVPPNCIEAYILVTEACMNQNFFLFRGKFYKQTFGLSMGSKLSPLLAEAFMSDFEVGMQQENMIQAT